MTLTKDDLNAISKMMDDKFVPVNTRLDGMDRRLVSVESGLIKVYDRLTYVEVVQIENTILPQLQLLTEGHQQLAHKNQ